MPRIADYAFLGDLHTGILVSCQGSVDWCCLPRFDSAACFAALLGAPDHGRWLMTPVDPASRSRRLYRAGTLILETLYEAPEGAVRVIDFMPPRGDAPDIVRIVEGVRGVVAMRSELVVRFDYGRIVPWVWKLDNVWVAIAGPDALCLRTPVETPALFVSKYRKPLSARAVEHLFHTYLGVAQIEDASPHTLRHTMATHMIKSGATLRSVQEMLGHANIQTTSRYVSLAEEQLHKDVQDHAL